MGETTSTSSQGRKRPREEEEDDLEEGQEDREGSVVEIHVGLDDQDCLEFVEFAPSAEVEEKRDPPKSMANKHFNQQLSEEERKAMMKESPVPPCSALLAPMHRMYEQVK